jgi:hypothetical protein
MRLQVCGVDHDPLRLAALARQRGENLVEHTQTAPANKPIVDRLMRTILSWCVAPAKPVLDHKYDRTHNPPVVHPRDPMRKRKIALIARSRDRAGLYAEAARQGAPQAIQVADRFHLLQNFRETIERQLGRYEAPIQDSHVNPDDSQATLPLSAQPDCPSEAVTQKRLMRRGRQATVESLDDWLIDARAPGIFAMQRFARTIRQDLEVVRNAVSEPWSNGQTEGQITD